jgi:hypothetical protein
MSATDDPVQITVESGSNLSAGHADLTVLTSSATVRVLVPTFSGAAEFVIGVERSGDGESWAVWLPFLAEDGVRRLPDGHDISNGWIYVGAPDEEGEA